MPLNATVSGIGYLIADLTVPQVKPKHLNGLLVIGCRIAYKSSSLHINIWDVSEAKNSKCWYNQICSNIFPKIVCVIFSSSYDTDVCSNVNFSDQLLDAVKAGEVSWLPAELMIDWVGWVYWGGDLILQLHHVVITAKTLFPNIVPAQDGSAHILASFFYFCTVGGSGGIIHL